MRGLLPLLLALAAGRPMGEETQGARIMILDAGSGWLIGADIKVRSGLRPQAKARACVEALLGRGMGQGAVFPEGTRLLRLFMAPGAAVVVDLSAEALGTSSGASAETLTAQALVLTLTANLPGVEKVLIMIEGKKRETLAGHLGLLEPLKPMEALVKKSERRP